VSEWAEANFDSAHYYARLMREDAISRKDKTSEIKAALALGVTHDYHNHIDSARHYYHLARSMSEEVHDEENLARANFNLATLEYAAGNYLLAIEEYRKTELIFKKLNNERALSRIYNNLGQVFLRSEQFTYAISYFLQSIELKKKLNDAKGQLNSFTNLSIAYRKAREYSKAVSTSGYVLALSQELVDSLAYRNELANLGEIYHEMGKPDSALVLFKEAESLLKQDDPASFKMTLWNNLADIYLLKSNYAKSKHYLQQAAAIADVDPVQKLYYLKVQAKFFAATGQFAQAYAYQAQLMDESNKQTSETVLKKLREYEVLFETEKKEHKISSLELEKKESDLREQRSAFQRNIFVGIALALFSIAAVVLWQYRQKQKINAKLSAALAEREILLKEIHHRVKNNLQVISSLLNLQSKNVKDKSVQEAVLEGRNRVKSMSIIHEHLYQKNNLTGIAMNVYIHELYQGLFRAYGKDEEDIELHANIDPIVLDVDTAIPLGLIVNELLTNSLKYAFPENSTGTIRIHLKRENSALRLHVADTGIGKNVASASAGFGMELITILAEKLKAKITERVENGTETELLITKFKIIETT
jgi:two-component sensor histidine kinase/tetratricopeptide (TPR) repeat protein